MMPHEAGAAIDAIRKVRQEILLSDTDALCPMRETYWHDALSLLDMATRALERLSNHKKGDDQ